MSVSCVSRLPPVSLNRLPRCLFTGLVRPVCVPAPPGVFLPVKRHRWSRETHGTHGRLPVPNKYRRGTGVEVSERLRDESCSIFDPVAVRAVAALCVLDCDSRSDVANRSAKFAAAALER